MRHCAILAPRCSENFVRPPYFAHRVGVSAVEEIVGALSGGVERGELYPRCLIQCRRRRMILSHIGRNGRGSLFMCSSSEVAELSSHSPYRIYKRTLAACIGTALAAYVVTTSAADRHDVPPTPVTVVVTNCDDSGPGSLRDALAMNPDNIDMTQLTCSLITLTSGELSTQSNDLVLFGNSGTIVSGNGASRVLSQQGSGKLQIFGLDFADGAVTDSNPAVGGCIYSEGHLYLRRVTIENCSVSAASGFTTFAAGGGVFASGDAHVYYSSIRDNAVYAGSATYSYSRGGGLYVSGTLLIDHSTVSGNVVHSFAGAYTSGGGLFTRSRASIRYSTLSGNNAYFAGAGQVGSEDGIAEIINSTISGNTAVSLAGIASAAALLRVWDSTIAFNVADRGGCGGGVVLFEGQGSYLSANNAIIANNTSGGSEDDVCVSTFGGVVGHANVIIEANVALPQDTIQSDPMLGPLADNGGATQTCALLPGSPAIDAGDDYAPLQTYDQRGTGFARMSGPHIDIGAFEVQQPPPPNEIFANGFD